MGAKCSNCSPPNGYCDKWMKFTLLSNRSTRRFNWAFQNKSSIMELVFLEHKRRLCPKRVVLRNIVLKLQFESRSCVPALGWTATCHAGSHALHGKWSRGQTDRAVLLYAPVWATTCWTNSQADLSCWTRSLSGSGLTRGNGWPALHLPAGTNASHILTDAWTEEC